MEKIPHLPSPARAKRLAGVIAAGILLISAAAGYLYIRQSRPVGQGPAGPDVSKADFQLSWSERNVFLVGLGDSVTAGFGARKGYSYFDRLVANPSDEFDGMRGVSLKQVLPGLQFTNLAVSGSTSFEHVERQLPNLQTHSNAVGLVVMTTGGNDLIHNYGRTPPREEAMYGATWEEAQPWIEHFRQRLNLMIDRIGQRFPAGCHIFLATIYDPTDGVGDIEHAGLPPWKDAGKILAAYNQMIRQCAADHPSVHVVDLHAAFLGHGIHCAQFWNKNYDAKDPHYWYYYNLEDPNERGYDAIRRLFLNEIAKIAQQLK